MMKNVKFECLSVDWDDATVRIRMSDGSASDWDRDFQWCDIARVCFKDEGIALADTLFVELRGQKKLAVIPMEAQRGTEFLDELVKRGLFPNDAFAKAIRSVTGGTYCWPPIETPTPNPESPIPSR